LILIYGQGDEVMFTSYQIRH